MRRRFLAFFVFLLPFSASASNRLEYAMERLAAFSDEIESVLAGRSDAAAGARAAESMAGLFAETASMHAHRFGGDLDRWRADCDAGRRLALGLRDRFAAADWSGAGESFRQIQNLKASAHRTFRSGFWRRLRRVFHRDAAARVPEKNKTEGEEAK